MRFKHQDPDNPMPEKLNPLSARERLIVALDVPTVDQAREIVRQLGDNVSFYKIGHQLAFIGGLELASELKAADKKVFLDLKLLDIDNTIEKGIVSIIRTGVDMLTLHAYPKAMRAAVKAAGDSQLCLLGVTVLTSMDREDLEEAGYSASPRELVLKRAEQAKQAGMGGIVCSAEEAADVREVIGPDMSVVTPGIRLAGSDTGDQKRVMTPYSAIRAGASHLVVGRPVVAASDKVYAATNMISQIEKALSDQNSGDSAICARTDI